MSTESVVTMQDLELEHAELLPGRETLCACNGYQGHQQGFSFTQIGGANYQEAGLFNNLVNISGNNIVL